MAEAESAMAVDGGAEAEEVREEGEEGTPVGGILVKVSKAHLSLSLSHYPCPLFPGGSWRRGMAGGGVRHTCVATCVHSGSATGPPSAPPRPRPSLSLSHSH